MLANNLKKARKGKGLSQEALAEKVHVVRQTISKWENGLSVPDAEMLVRLAQVLDTSVSALLESGSEQSGETMQLEEIRVRLDTISAMLNQRARKQAWIRRAAVLRVGAGLAAVLFVIILLLLSLV